MRNSNLVQIKIFEDKFLQHLFLVRNKLKIVYNKNTECSNH